MDTPLAAGGMPGYWLLVGMVAAGTVAAGTPAAGNTPEVAPGRYTAAAAG